MAKAVQKFNAKEWIENLISNYGEITSEIMDDLVSAGILTYEQAEQVYDLYYKTPWLEIDSAEGRCLGDITD